MPAGRPTSFTPARIKELAKLLFLGFTDEQIALYLGINRKTIYRARIGEFCPAVKRAEIAREIMYRERTWNGDEGWQGAAWNLERKYPTQFSRPEVQLNVNNDNRQVHQTLVIQAEVAGQINDRVKSVRSKLNTLFNDKRPNSPNSNPDAKAPDA